MNLKNKPPVFVPAHYRAEIEKLSKAALMDIAWDYASQLAVDREVISELRDRIEIIQTYRRQS